MSIQSIVDQLQQVHFSDSVTVTFGVAAGVTGTIEGHPYVVATRKLEYHLTPHEQLKLEIERDVVLLEQKHPEYTNYHIRVYSLQGNLLRYGKLVTK